jgi:uncharacterized membrane protein
VMKSNLKTLSVTSLLAAVICVSTMVIQIPSPMQGYVNLGDCFVLIAGWILGPFYGFLAAGIGSALADIFTSYAHYAPATFLIKGMMALVCALLVRALPGKPKIARLSGSLAAEFFMVLGYFGYACLLLGKGMAALSSIPGNLMQGLFGIVSGYLLFEAFDRVKILHRFFRDAGGGA